MVSTITTSPLRHSAPPTPLISVVIPTYNRLNFLQKAVSSVIQQTFQGWELLIIDDGSHDGTLEWVENELIPGFPDKKIFYTHTENQGVSAARNLGSIQAKGAWLAYLDSDDEWLPHKLQSQWDFIVKSPQTPLVHGEEIWVRRGQVLPQKQKHKKSGGRIFTQCLPLCCISPSTVMLSKQLFIETSGFKEEYPVCEDYDLWLRICSKHSVGFITQPLIKKYGGHEDQLSHRYFAMDYWRVKSLFSIKDSPYLSEMERCLLYEEIIKKSVVLLKGYKKHQNLDDYNEISKIYDLTRHFLNGRVKAAILVAQT